MTRATYTINLPDALKEYARNQQFREALQTGMYVYAEGSYVPDTPVYVSQETHGLPRLTPYARHNIEDIALAFEERYVRELTQEQYRSGNKIDELKKLRVKTYKHKIKSGDEKDMEIHALHGIAADHKEYFDACPVKTCWQHIWGIITAAGSNSSDVEVRANLKSYFFSHAKGNALGHSRYTQEQKVREYPSYRDIIAFAIGYCLSLDKTRELLALTGQAFNPTSWEHQLHQFVLTSMRAYDINTVCEFLEEEGVPLFKPRGKDKDEEE